MGSNQIQDILTELAHGRDLTAQLAERAFQILLSGGATPAQIGAFLMGLRAKGETVTEITAGAQVLRHKARTFTALEGAIDTCGTGGDGKRSYNISTAVAIVAAACGVPVVKHGNRGVTSASGSSDILTALGVTIDASPEQCQTALEQTQLCFLMAPLYHQTMRHVAPVRQELGLRTIFNLLGPLANPARTRRQLLGVYSRHWLRPMAEVLRELGAEKAWVVHGADGMDELTTTDVSYVAALEDGEITEFEISPGMLDLPLVTEDQLRGGLPEDNARALQGVLSGVSGPYRDIVILNTAAALVVADRCHTLDEAATLAHEAIDSGQARQTLAAFVEATKPPEAESRSHG